VQYLPVELDEKGGGGLVRAQVEQMLAAFAAGDPWFAANPPIITWLVDADCGETPDSELIVTTPLDAMRGLGIDPVIQGVPAHSDMGLPIKAGVPTITFGPGQLAIAHQPNEYVPLDEYKKAIQVMAVTIVELCAN
jgi:acetylornithine deacetylase